MAAGPSTTADEVTKAERALHFTLERIDSETAFVLHQVEPMFCPKTCFSDLDLRLSDDERKVALNFYKLFKVETKPEFNEAVNFIHRCRHRSNGHVIMPIQISSTLKNL